MPSDLTYDKLENVAIPDISQFIGSEELAEHLGIALKEGYNGSINAHININARIMGGKFQVSEEAARLMIDDWIKRTDFELFKNEVDIGMTFLTEIISKIVD